MESIKKQIIAWFNSPQDYDQGLKLLQAVSKKNKIIAKLIKRGESRGSFEKLVWELNKFAGLKKIPVPKAKIEKRIVKIAAPEPKSKEAKQTAAEEDKDKMKYNLIGKNDIGSYPADVRRLVKEYSSKYMQRGKLHKGLTALGESNDDVTLAQRVDILGKIKSVTERMEVLFTAFKNFQEKGIQVESEILWPEENKEDPRAQAGIENLTIEELKNLKKNIQSSSTKDRNQLLYGSKTKQEKENPMPAGPKRTTLEKRIAKKDAEILAIDQRIADLG